MTERSDQESRLDTPATATEPVEAAATEVGYRRINGWLDLFAAADRLVGMDYDADEVYGVLRTYLEHPDWYDQPRMFADLDA